MRILMSLFILFAFTAALFAAEGEPLVADETLPSLLDLLPSSSLYTPGETRTAGGMGAAGSMVSADEEGSVIDRFMERHGEFGRKAARYHPMIEGSFLYMPDAEVNNERGEFDLTHYRLDAMVPIPMDVDTFLIAGAKTEARRYNFNSDVRGPRDDTLYGIGARIGVGHFFRDDFVVQAYWQPTINSDLDSSLENDDWKWYYGAALAVYRQKENLFWKAGVAFTDVIDSTAVPLLGFSWIFDPKWRLDVLAPRNAEVSYLPDERSIIFAGFEMDGDEYHVEQRTSAGKRDFDVNVQEVRLYIGGLNKVTDNLSISAKAGINLAGRYEWNNGVDNRYDGDLETGPFLRVALGWSF